jgi:hypothetical protein
MVCAECPKTKEKPKMIVASGTRDSKVFALLKIKRHTKIIPTKATVNRTPSSLDTTELAS